MLTLTLSIAYHCNGIRLLILAKHVIGLETAANFTSLPYCPFMNAIVFTYRQSTIQIYIVARFILYVLQPLENNRSRLIQFIEAIKSERIK